MFLSGLCVPRGESVIFLRVLCVLCGKAVPFLRVLGGKAVRFLNQALVDEHRAPCGHFLDRQAAGAGVQAFSATSTSSSIFFASPNSMRLFSL